MSVFANDSLTTLLVSLLVSFYRLHCQGNPQLYVLTRISLVNPKERTSCSLGDHGQSGQTCRQIDISLIQFSNKYFY